MSGVMTADLCQHRQCGAAAEHIVAITAMPRPQATMPSIPGAASDHLFIAAIAAS